MTIQRKAYDLVYDGQHKQARWFYEHLTAESLQGDSDRLKFDFKEDPLIHKSIRATKEDFLKSGFDQGHLCPAADAKFSDEAIKETFYLSNVSSQCPQFNRGYWSMLEKHVREVVKKHGSIHVFTGGLYLPREEGDGKRYVKYQVIGKNDVAVPTHYFKIVMNEGGVPIESFILPNEAIDSKTPLKDFATTVDTVGKAAGLIFNY